jgi:hypothetical protein
MNTYNIRPISLGFKNRRSLKLMIMLRIEMQKKTITIIN